MADAAAVQKADAPAPGQKKKGGLFPWMIVGSLMFGQGIGVFFLARALSPGPATAAAEEARAAPEGEHAPADGHEKPAHADSGNHGDSGSGHDSHGASTGSEGSPMSPNEQMEVKLAECKTVNKGTGKLVLFHMRVTALVSGADAERAKKLIEAKQGRIDDRVNTVIRSAEPQQLNEPGLQTLKRRFKFEFDRIFEDDKLVKEVLIPHIVQSGSGL
ncbi:MAG: flagellar basal body-associated FliL family protein [Planctomycetota bacterium]